MYVTTTWLQFVTQSFRQHLFVETVSCVFTDTESSTISNIKQVNKTLNVATCTQRQAEHE